MPSVRFVAALTLGLLGCDRDCPTPTVTNGTAAAPATVAAATPTATSTARAAPTGRPASSDPFAVQARAVEQTVAAVAAAFNAHDAKALAALYDPACVVLSPRPGGFPAEVGREPLVVGHEALFASQPDVRRATARLLIAGDHAVEEWVTRGTTAQGKVVGFRAATVYRFGGDGKVARDETYFDLTTSAAQAGKKPGEARVPPPMPEKAVTIVAGDGPRDARAAWVLRTLHATLALGRRAEAGAFLAPDVVESSTLATTDAKGSEAVLDELGKLSAQLPRPEVTGAWGDADVGAAQMVFRGPARDGGPEAALHVLHVVDLAKGRIQKSTLYGNRRELEDE